MSEKEIEKALIRAVKAMGGLCWKFTSPGTDGVPDRIVMLSGCRLAFVEVKAPGQTLRSLQVQRKRQLEALGFRVYCVDGKEQIEEVLNEIQAT